MRSPTLQAEIEAARDHLNTASAQASQAKSPLALPQRRLAFIAAAILVLAVSAALLYPAWHRKPAIAAQAPALAHPSASLAASPAAAHPAIFFLPALHLRGAAAIPTLHLSESSASSAPQIELQVEIRGHAPQSITLRQGDTIIYTQDHPSLQTAASIQYLSLLMDRARLNPGNYQLEIASENKAGAPDRRSFLIR